ncbi:MAG: hypothetical protein HQ490_04580 [Lutibacter sp.]|nr:hypothetical protein [Lutibacter sp.]
MDILLEIISCFLGISVLWVEIFKLKCKNIVTSIFIACYVPLFCIFPLVARAFIGGATSINKINGGIFIDSSVYIIFQLYNLLLLVCLIMLYSIARKKKKNRFEQSNVQSYEKYTGWLFALIILGVYLYIQSTGLSIIDLLIASRFEWFSNPNYSSFWAVIASYLIALSPIVTYLSFINKQKFIFICLILVLVFYGVLSKDRKWVIFIFSGLIAGIYTKNNNKIEISIKYFLIMVSVVSTLAFWQILRDTLFDEIVTGKGEFEEFSERAGEMGLKLMKEGDLPYFYNSSVTAINMNFHDGYTIPLGLLRRQLFFAFPADYSLGLKIKDISAIFSDKLNAGDSNRGGNMPPGSIGLFALSFYWWGGLIMYISVPITIFLTDKVILQKNSLLKIVILSNAFSSVILFLRGDDSSATYFIMFNFGIGFLIKLLKSVSKKNIPKFHISE